MVSSLMSAGGKEGIGGLVCGGISLCREDDDAGSVDSAELAELFEMREKLDALHGHATVNFDWELRGSKWTLDHKGTAYDTVAARGKGEVVRNWCLANGFGREAHFAVSRFGEMRAVELATWWCAKMEYIYCAFLECRGAALWKDKAAAWIEPIEMTEAAARAEGPLKQRLEQIRRIRPRL